MVTTAYPMAFLLTYIVWHVVAAVVVLSVLMLAYRAYGDTPEHRGAITQVLGGLVIVMALYYTSLFALHQDSLVRDDTVDVREPVRTKIIDGYTEVPLIVDRSFDTVDPDNDSFVAMPRSFNRRGGAQFTYQMWLYLDNVSQSNIAGQTILLRGDTNVYSWNDVASGTVQKGAAIACPSIAFGASYDQLKVRFNTLDSISNEYDTQARMSDVAAEGAEGAAVSNKLLKLIAQNWVLFTFVFEDDAPVSEFENGVRLRFFVNDFLYDHASFPGKALRQNNGPLYVFPSVGGASASMNGARVADLSYYNYAVGAEQVSTVFQAGPPKKHATTTADGDHLGEPLYLSEFNKLDVYTA